MDPRQIAELREWARRLAERAASEEARAAARAILLLADEVDRLRGEVERGRVARPAVAAEPGGEGEEPFDDEPPEDEPPPAAGGSLRDRLKRGLGKQGESGRRLELRALLPRRRLRIMAVAWTDPRRRRISPG